MCDCRQSDSVIARVSWYYIQTEMKTVLSVFILFTISCVYVQGSRILCLSHLASPSHGITVPSVCQELARRNHQVVTYTLYPCKKNIPNYTEHVLEGIHEKLNSAVDAEEFQIFESQERSAIFDLLWVFEYSEAAITEFLEHPKVNSLLKSDEKFDLIYCDSFLSEALHSGFQQKLKVPVVLFQGFMANHWVNYLTGNPAPSAYIPDVFFEYDTKMTFKQRLVNFVFGLVHELMHNYVHLPTQNRLMRKYFGDHLPPVDQISKNTSLVLVNHHFSLAHPRPYVPNMIEVGGLHIQPPKELPKDIKGYLDNATDGAIFFSLGSNVKSSLMPKDKLQAFLQTLGRLKQKVLWKWETDNLPGKPDNVRISKWYPQSDILAHPNVRLFITHGGLGSIVETTHRGVPIVGIPVFAEQPINVMHAMNTGIGRRINFYEVTADSLYDAIQDVLNNPKYKENAVKRSQLLQDRPTSAMDTAVFWVEYVLRHDGAKHMRSAALDLSWYQLNLVDVYLVIITFIIAVLFINIYLFKWLFNKLFGRRSNKSTDKHKKNQ